jgi:hypothetical protein
MLIDNMLDLEFQYYIDNQAELVQRYNNRFLVIKDQEVKGDYESQGEAYEDARKKYELGTFLIQHCSSGPESYTHIFHSRVMVDSALS